MLTVLVPAHNEGEQIADTIQSLLSQTLPPDRIVVLADNCSDDTVAIASRFPVVVHETVDNAYRKSGALNQGWSLFCSDADYIFTMDADTVLAPDFFELSVKLMDENSDLGGACACPMLKETPAGISPWGDILWRMGKNDFGGYMRLLCRWNFAPEVLFGYGTIFRSTALAQLAAESVDGMPFDVHSIVEDYKATIGLRRLGWRLQIIPGAFAYTDVPVTLRELWTQRLRWAGGTWQELARAGWKPYTRRVWYSAVGSIGSAVLRVLGFTAWILVLALHMDIAWSPLWLIPIIIGFIDRIDVTRYTKNSDWKDVMLAGTFLPIELMSIVREAWTIRSAWIVARKRHLSW